MTLVQRLWDRAHGQHLAITATASGGGGVAFGAAAFHLIALRPLPDWEAMTGLAISVLALTAAAVTSFITHGYAGLAGLAAAVVAAIVWLLG